MGLQLKNQALVVFTEERIEEILERGGTQSWLLARDHALKCALAICTRNARGGQIQHPEPHASAFLIGKIRKVEPSPDPKYPDRYLVQLSEYALIASPNVWPGNRNPVNYVDVERFAVLQANAKWNAMPDFRSRSKVDPTTRRDPAQKSRD